MNNVKLFFNSGKNYFAIQYVFFKKKNICISKILDQSIFSIRFILTYFYLRYKEN